MQSYDQSYKTLFENPKLVEQLLTSFVDHDWIQTLDFSGMTDISAEYFGSKRQMRRGDMLYRIPLKGHPDQAVFVVLLIEFQSTIYKWMLLRMLEYLALFYRKFVRQHPQTEKLPVVFPIVLYNGEKRWQQLVDMRDVLSPYPELPEAYQLRFRYFKIAVNEQDPTKLTQLGNAIGTLMLAEQDLKNVEEVGRLLVALFNHPENRDLAEDLYNWYLGLVEDGRLPSTHGERLDEIIQEKEKVPMMLRQALQQQYRRAHHEGLLVGRYEGLLEGRQEGLLEGHNRGLQEGRNEGQEIGELNAVLAMLELTLGVQPTLEQQAQLKGLMAQLGFKAVMARALHAKQLADVLIAG